MEVQGISDLPKTDEYRERKVELGKEDFLRLLAVQLRFQDPLEPIGSTEFAAQLAQFSALEQMKNLNDRVRELTELYRSNQTWTALPLIGRSVKVEGDEVPLYEGRALIGYTLNSPADVRVRIWDGDKVIRSVDLGLQEEGEHLWEWDGEDDRGRRVPDGSYRYEVLRVGDGDTSSVDGYVLAEVAGVRPGRSGEPMLDLGVTEVGISKVREIVDSQRGGR
ncbi:MAG TPA: flagellar hook assembly protein FlgD [Candidatus Latescibacteria bacterium]|nr:flagellar hook assembly protein FlgD [Candidatus Latescibacterota bacterium]